MNKMGKMIRNMTAGMTIVVEDLEVEGDSMEIGAIDHDDQFSVSCAIKKAIDMQTVCIKIGST